MCLYENIFHCRKMPILCKHDIPLNGGVVFDSNALKYALPGRHTSQLDQLAIQTVA